MRGRKILMLALGLALLGLAGVAMADSISPSSFSGSGPTGASYTVNKTVTVNAGTPTTSLVDVFFLADTTGSMGSAIASVKTGAAGIMSSAAGLGNVAFGVGEYKDVGDTFVYRLNQAVTTNTAAVQTGINQWGASGGGDEPEAQLFALQQVASSPATGFRPGSARILVWFGDAPGHDPRNGATQASATAALQAANVKVEAISVGANRLNLTGQAAAIAAATGGHFTSGIDQAAIVAAINAAITTAVTTYSTVSIDTSEVPAGVGITVTPGSYTGSFDRSIARTFEFTVTFTDLEAGTHTFNIYATVDGGRVATEADTIVSEGPVGVPEPATLVLLGTAFIALAGLRRKIAK